MAIAQISLLFLNYLHGSELSVLFKAVISSFLNYLHGSELVNPIKTRFNAFLNYLHGSEPDMPNAPAAIPVSKLPTRQ